MLARHRARRRHRWSGGLAEGSRARQRLPGRRGGFHFRCPRGAARNRRSSRAGEAASPARAILAHDATTARGDRRRDPHPDDPVRVRVLVVLAILSLGTLISIFLAAVLAFGLDPIVASLVKRGWKRGRGLAGGVRRAVRLGVRARARHRRPGLGPDPGIRPLAAGDVGGDAADRTGSRASSAPRGPTTRSPTCSRISRPGCPTPRARCWARRAASSARCSPSSP